MNGNAEEFGMENCRNVAITMDELKASYNDPSLFKNLLQATRGKLNDDLRFILDGTGADSSACTLEEYLKLRISAGDRLFFSYDENGTVIGFVGYSISRSAELKLQKASNVVICPYGLDEKSSFTFIYSWLHQIASEIQNHGEICWKAREGSLLETASDAVLVDLDGERDVEAGAVLYKVVK